MEQFKRNFPYCLFVCLGLKLLILGTSNLFDVLALLVLGLGLAFFELRVENKKFLELSNKINGLELDNLRKSEKIKEIEEKMNSIRIVQGMKQQAGRNGG